MYFFGYIMKSHNARDPNRRKAFLLSQLQHNSDWIGSLVHKCIAHEFVPSVTRESPISESELVERIVSLS